MLDRILRLIYDLRSWRDPEPVAAGNFALLERDFARKLGLPNFDWVLKEEHSPIHLPRHPLDACRVALVTTAGVHQAGQRPFALRLSGDDSFRVIAGDADVSQLRVRHGGYDTRRARKDLNCIFPLERLRELVAQGLIGSAASRHISFMGYIPDTTDLEQVVAPMAARILLDDAVDLVLLSPA